MFPGDSELQRLVSPTDYVSSRGNVFPSLEAFLWWRRQHRKQLLAAGAEITINRRTLLDPDRCDSVVLAVGRDTAGDGYGD
jgi:hypothetical protein